MATGSRCFLAACVLAPLVAFGGQSNEPLRSKLDAPLLFVKRFNQQGIHIYDNFFKWRPGGGIYILENPADPPEKHRIRPLVGPEAPGTLGNGMYWDPDISYDGKRVLFCYKDSPGGNTSIYEIGIDGKGLRRLTDPSPYCSRYKGSHSGVHDMQPAYLPDGRIIFTSTRPGALVPCANEGVNILHVMNPDGSDIHPISVNNVNEFDPCVMPDGRILHGRWEYVDKTALTQQSLWTIFPDGTNETALFANNMVHPEACLDARPVPGAPHLIVCAFTPHNSPPRGSIAMIDTRLGKNSPDAIFNFEHPDRPTFDRGNSCEPWPLSADLVLYSGQAPGRRFNAIMLIDRSGRREVVFADPRIDCHDPMLVKPRPRPPVIQPATDRGSTTGRFLVLDIYQGLTGIRRGEVKALRIIEETSRISPTPGGAMNQTFLMSGVLGWCAKNYLGVVPVEADGSAYFEAPSGRTLYLQALDTEGRLVQSMRTFVQAAPGVTRSCIGCHEHKFSTPVSRNEILALKRPPSKPQPESWGSGFIDFPSMVQPILDRHCVRCHGGPEGFAGRLDLTGGWTEHFSISYENLVSRRHSQLVAHLIAGIDCMNGTSLYSAPIRPPRFHGSGAAPLAEVLVSGHEGRIPDLTRPERDLIMAWIDTNGLYHGTWDYSRAGCSTPVWRQVKAGLVREMQTAGCMRCHGDRRAQPVFFDDDWFNLRRPEFSRILRAPLAKGGEGHGAELCRNCRVDPRRRRIYILRTGRYLHAVTPLSAFKPQPVPADPEAEPYVPFRSTADPHYQRMLEIIREGRRRALANPRVDMPGAEVIPGAHRQFIPTPIPDPLPKLEARADREGIVHLRWERSARTIGLSAEVHRGPKPGFAPSDETRLATTSLFFYDDRNAEPGLRHYALVLCSGDKRSEPVYASVEVPKPSPPPAPRKVVARGAPGQVELTWEEVGGPGVRYNVYRAKAGERKFARLTPQPLATPRFADPTAPERVPHIYVVRAVNRRGIEGPASPAVEAAALPEPKEPVFAATFAQGANGAALDGARVPARLHGKARVSGGVLDLSAGGHLTFPHRGEFDLRGRFSVECWVRFTKRTQMPVIVSCGVWQRAGWFLQWLGNSWRWHVGGIDCDGGRPKAGEWIHLVGTYDGRTARLYENGRLVAERGGTANLSPWAGPLHVGQYSGGPAPQYQVFGQTRGLRLYARALRLPEIASAAR